MAGTTRSSRPRLARLGISAASPIAPDARPEDPTWTRSEEEMECEKEGETGQEVEREMK